RPATAFWCVANRLVLRSAQSVHIEPVSDKVWPALTKERFRRGRRSVAAELGSSFSRYAITLDHGKPLCFGPFLNDELNLRVAENALQRAKLAKNSDCFLGGYRKGTQAIGAGDYVVL